MVLICTCFLVSLWKKFWNNLYNIFELLSNLFENVKILKWTRIILHEWLIDGIKLLFKCNSLLNLHTYIAKFYSFRIEFRNEYNTILIYSDFYYKLIIYL